MNLSLFCDSELSRYDLQKPFAQSGWRCATDGRIIVRVPTDAEDDTGKYPNIGNIFDSCPECTQAWPKWKHSRLDCPRCDGSGKTLVECTVCEAFGNHVCPSCRQEHTCGRCEGKGKIPGDEKCVYCEGRKYLMAPNGEDWEGRRVLTIDGRRFDVFYLALIEQQADTLTYSIGREDWLYFQSDGNMQGALCPLVDV